MPTIKLRTAVLASSQNDNILSGSQFEFVKRLSKVEIFATGDDFAEQRISVFFGDRLQLSDGRPNAEVTPGAVSIDTDKIVDEVAVPGERLVVRLNNDDAGATRNFNTLIKVTPLA